MILASVLMIPLWLKVRNLPLTGLSPGPMNTAYTMILGAHQQVPWAKQNLTTTALKSLASWREYSIQETLPMTTPSHHLMQVLQTTSLWDQAVPNFASTPLISQLRSLTQNSYRFQFTPLPSMACQPVLQQLLLLSCYLTEISDQNWINNQLKALQSILSCTCGKWYLFQFPFLCMHDSIS